MISMNPKLGPLGPAIGAELGDILALSTMHHSQTPVSLNFKEHIPVL
jgi:hypothetical protein